MLGDLLETGKEKGKLWFWLSVSGVALSLFWRRPLAFFVAYYAGSQMQYFSIMASMHHHPGNLWMQVYGLLDELVDTMWCLSLYAAIRYGLQERTTQMALAWTGICAVTIYFSWQPIVLTVSIGAAFCFVTTAMWTSKRRRESAVVLMTVAIGYAAKTLAAFSYLFLLTYCSSRAWGAKVIDSAIWFYYTESFLSFWVATSAWSYMRDRLMRRTLLESHGEML